MMRATTLSAVLLSLCVCVHTATIVLDSSALDGTWTVKNENGSIKAPAVVPGGIYTDLRTAGLLTQDIYYRFNDLDYRWVSKENWTYSRNFQVEAEFLQKLEIQLVLHGVDTVASVYINDEHVGDCENMFVRYTFPIKALIKTGENKLEVRFVSSITAAKQRADEQSLNYTVPPDCVPDAYKGECHINQLRKMQASFSWDWGPAFPSAGLWKSVVLEAFDTAVLREVTVSTEEDEDKWNLDIKVFLEAGQQTTTLDGNIKATLELDSGPMEVTLPVVAESYQPGQLTAGISMKIPKDQVELWWPNEYGDQKLYNLSVTFYENTDTELGQVSLRIGFRTIELVQEPVAVGEGLTFYIKVNNIPIFAKGSNWIPSYILPEKSAEPEKIHHLLSSSKVAHMNMLRVWGGGLYESDLFYQLADEMGILIWQDFLFACSMYPTRPQYLQSVTIEVMQQVHRLQNHPSVAIWAGNNENEIALRDNWYGTSGNFELYKADYIKLYVDTIRPTVLAQDSTRPFVVASPSNGIKSEEEGYIAESPGSPLYGDIHYYNYLADGWNPNTYTITRFASEYGFQSLPSFETLSKVSEPSDWSMQSEFMDHRQHHPGGNSEMKFEIDTHLQLPNNGSTEEEFLVFIYFSQINQAMSIKTETEFYRRGRSLLTSAGQGRTMGALYWQLNDIWQGPSWASIEVGGRWKFLHYFAQNFFAPVLVSPLVTGAGNLQVHLISDLLEDKQTTLTILVYKWNSLSPIYIVSSNHTLHNASVTKVFDNYLSEFLSSAGCGSSDAVRKCFLYFMLTTQDGDNISPDNFLFPGPLKQLIDFTAPEITVTSVTQIGSDTFQIELTTNGIAAFVSLEAYNIIGQFSDNGFIMVTPTKTIEFIAKQNVTSEQLQNAITIVSLADYY